MRNLFRLLVVTCCLCLTSLSANTFIDSITVDETQEYASVVQLGDGSVWAVYKNDLPTLELWEPGTPVYAAIRWVTWFTDGYYFLLYREDTGDYVRAMLLDPGPITIEYVSKRYLYSMTPVYNQDENGNQVFLYYSYNYAHDIDLSDGTCWTVDASWGNWLEPGRSVYFVHHRSTYLVMVKGKQVAWSTCGRR